MDSPIRITQPIHGDVVNRTDLYDSPDAPLLGVFGEAPEGVEVTVNGVVAERQDGLFRCKVPLAAVKTELVAELAGGTGRDTATILWDRSDRKQRNSQNDRKNRNNQNNQNKQRDRKNRNNNTDKKKRSDRNNREKKSRDSNNNEDRARKGRESKSGDTPGNQATQ